jgi:hypothetical protein
VSKITDPNIIFQVAESILPGFIQAHQDELGDRKGLYAALLKKDTSKTKNSRKETRVKRIGYIPKEKQNEKLEYAIEKVSRLFFRNMTETGSNIELSSFESENVEKKQFGGGITCKDYYMSVSGFPPHLDQKFVLLVALCVGQITFKQAHDIYERSYLQQQKWIKK